MSIPAIPDSAKPQIKATLTYARLQIGAAIFKGATDAQDADAKARATLYDILTFAAAQYTGVPQALCGPIVDGLVASLSTTNPVPVVPPVPVTPVVPVVPVTPPAIAVDDVDASNAQTLNGPDITRMAITRNIKATSNGYSVRYEGDAPDWPRGNGSLVGPMTYIYFMHNGVLTGGKFDWGHGRNPDTKDWGENTMPGSRGNGVFNGVVPAHGAQLWFCEVSNDGHERSQLSAAGVAP